MVVVLSNAGDHVPFIPLVEAVGKGDNASPLQIGATAANVGVVAEFTVTVTGILVALIHEPSELLTVCM